MGKKVNYFKTGGKAILGSLITAVLVMFSSFFIAILTAIFLPLILVYIILIVFNVFAVGFVYNKLWGWK